METTGIYQIRYMFQATEYNAYKLEVSGQIMHSQHESVVDSICALSIGGFDGLSNGHYVFEFGSNVAKDEIFYLLNSVNAIEGFN